MLVSLWLWDLWLARCFLVLNVLSHDVQGISSSLWTSLLCCVSVFWDLNCLPQILQTKSEVIIVNFGFFRYFDPLQARVCFRLTLKLCLETFTFLMTGATQASCRNKWLSVLLWDLKGLRGKRIAQNMGTKIGLIKLIYFVIFCAGWNEAHRA